MKQISSLALLLLTASITLAQTRDLRTSDREGSFGISTGSAFSASGGTRKKAEPRAADTIENDLEDAIKLIEQNYVDGTRLKKEKLTQNSIRSMLRELDPHSNFYDRDEYAELQGEHQNQYTGTGISISTYIIDGRRENYVVGTFPGSPSAAVGLAFGDRIAAVDGTQCSGLDSAELRDLIRGPASSTVRLLIEKAATGQLVEIRLKRQHVRQASVPVGAMLEKGVGYLDMRSGFTMTTAAETAAAIAQLKANGMTSLVIDLRGNSGGILEEAIKVAEIFLPKGSAIVTQAGRYPTDGRIWTSGSERPETMPLVLLVDGRTASASEILAGALQDNDRAIIIGERTYGKGLVQTVIDLPAGTGMTLTSSRYLTPAGRSIQRDYSSGLYDYYRHTAKAADIDRPEFAAKTVSGRVVFGGDGIAPDIERRSRPLTISQARLIDPIFFFVRQSVLEHRDPTVDTIAAFTAFAADRGYRIDAQTITAEADLIRSSAAIQFAAANGNSGEPERKRLLADEQIRLALSSISNAEQLQRGGERSRQRRTDRDVFANK